MELEVQSGDPLAGDGNWSRARGCFWSSVARSNLMVISVYFLCENLFRCMLMICVHLYPCMLNFNLKIYINSEGLKILK